jgi:hypothetical protein
MRAFVDLLPFEHHRNALLRRRLLQWSLICGICVLLALAGLEVIEGCCRVTRRGMEAARRSYLPVQELTRQNEDMQSELRRLQAKGTVFGQLCDERPLLTLIGLASQAARKCDGRLVIHRMSFQRHEEDRESTDPRQKGHNQAKQTPTARAEQPWATVSLAGDALDNLAVARFVVALRDSGVFRRVELKSSVGSKASDTETRSFTLNCEI